MPALLVLLPALFEAPDWEEARQPVRQAAMAGGGRRPADGGSPRPH